MSAVSRNNQETDPAFALTLNPFNSEATVNFVVGALNNEADPDLPRLSAAAGQMISASPADARGYSLMGALEERAGNSVGAELLYSVALQHSKSELHALLRTAQARLSASDTAGALERVDLLLRRWPAYWEQVQPVLLSLAVDQNTAPLLTVKLNDLPPWRGRAMAALGNSPEALPFLRGLIAAAPAELRSRPGWQAERDGVVAALVQNQAYVEAYTLFLGTLTPAEAEVSGYVFDREFRLPIGRSVFGWRIQKPGATEIGTGPNAGIGGSGLRVRFLDSPARPGIVSQNLMLPFGTYRLAVEVSTFGLKAPKDLFWSVKCVEGGSLATLPVAAGTVSDNRLVVDFEVAETGCSRQVLSLDTSVRTESWRDRYQGEVRFSDLAITRL